MSDVNFKLSRLLRIRIGDIVRGKVKAGSVVRDSECSIEEFRKHIESKFQPGMNWNNHGLFE